MYSVSSTVYKLFLDPIIILGISQNLISLPSLHFLSLIGWEL